MCEGLIDRPLLSCGRCDAKHGDSVGVLPNDVAVVLMPRTAPVLSDRPSSLTKDAAKEAVSILGLSLPMIMTGLILYVRPMISMLFLGRLGELALAGGSPPWVLPTSRGTRSCLALHRVWSPCAARLSAPRTCPRRRHHAAHGALPPRRLRPRRLPLTQMEPLLLLCGQEAAVSAAAQRYILFCVPDLFQSFLHPLRIYLRTQSINLPITTCAMIAVAVHLPINYFLVSVLGLGIEGVALACLDQPQPRALPPRIRLRLRCAP
ncbi:hypothetical protein QYE76_012201 [Lolium multiflorum]|uniref:Uncharacterized protein n=1 Tax=Lolium multiflorum TaxID=4521 RepID=A0AAD8U1F3_LOLMU|nr:hypothetical protein QYE76_012201 [Lolium multiflorum]